MNRNTKDKLTARLVGLVIAISLSVVAQKCMAGELALTWDAQTVSDGLAAGSPGSSSLLTRCVMGLLCQPLPGLLPDYGFSTTSGGLRALCLVSMLADAAVLFKREVDRQSGYDRSDSLFDLLAGPDDPSEVRWSPALTTIKHQGSIAGLALGLNGTF